MSAYITNTRPSLFKRFLHNLGIIDLPVKVNCWFCNQDSFLLPGTRNTPDHWNCHLCDNTNARDPKTGEVLDPSPFHTTQMPYNTPVKRSTNYTPNNKNNSRSICDDCIQNQALMYDILSKYIPDETDPSYQERCDNVDNEKRRLQNMYKLCDPCQSLVDMVVREQMELLNIRSLGRTFSSSAVLEEPLPKKPSAALYRSKKIIWFFTHSVTTLFIIHEIYNPTTWDVSELVEDVKKLPSLLMSINLQDISVENTSSIISKILGTLSIWNTTHMVLLCIIINFISLRGIHIHPLIDRHEADQVRNWSPYKFVQNILFVMRFIIVTVTILNLHEYNVYMLALYNMILLCSLFLVKVNRQKVKIRDIGSSSSKTFLEEVEQEENDDLLSVMDIDEPLSVVNNDDPVESLVYRLQSL